MGRCKVRKLIILAANATWLLPLSAVPAAAQGVSQNDQGGPADQLDDIVVTAQRRAERLQDVPISVSAVSANNLANRGIETLVGLSATVPGLQYQITAISPSIYLRGVGSNDGNPNVEPSVALYVDGVYIASPNASLNDFNNIERVEVLKGPQGTLFGRNATGGVIQIITKDPSHTPSAQFSAGYANYDTYSIKGYVTAPLTDTAAIDFALTRRNQRNGYGDEVNSGADIARSKNFAVRSKLLWEPTDALTVRISGDYAKSFTALPAFVLPKGVLGLDGLPTSGSFDARANVIPSGKVKQYGGAGHVTYDAGAVIPTSITSYRHTRARNVFDSDAIDLNVITADLPNVSKAFTQELQIGSPSSSKVQWIVGGFFYDNSVRYVYSRLAGMVIEAGGIPYLDINTTQKGRSYAAFGQATAELVDRVKFTGGLRYTTERQHYLGTVRTIFGENPVIADSQKFSKLTWRMALDYEISDNAHTYISYNRGVKSGGYNLNTPNSPPFQPEVLDAYEVGVKSELLDRRLRVNAAAFLYKYKNIQVQVVAPTGGTSTSQNAAAATIKGFEADVEALPFDDLTLNANFTVLDGKYDSYPGAPLFTASPLTPHAPFQDASGNDTVATSPFSGSVGFEYRIPSAIGKFSLTSSLYYNDGFYFGPDKNFPQKSYYLLSAAVNWASEDGKLGLRLWGANLTNDFYFIQGTPSGFGNLALRGDPRTYGITGTVKF